MSGERAPTNPRRPLRGRRGVALAVGIAVVLVFVLGGVARLQIETGVKSFVPAGDHTAKATAKVASAFGGDPMVVLLESKEPHELLSKENLPALLRLEGELSHLKNVAALYGPATVLNQIAGQAQNLLAELVGYRDGLRAQAAAKARRDGKSKTQANAAGQGATSDFDERYSSLLARGLPGGLPTLYNQKFVTNVVFNAAGEPRPQWDFVVPAEDAVAILVRPNQDLDQDAVEQLVRSVNDIVAKSAVKTDRVTVSGVPAIVSALGGQVRQEVPILGGLALLGVGAWFVFMRWTRRRFRLLPLAATLTGTASTLALAGWLSIPVSLGVVAFLPVLLGVGSDFMTYLHRRVEQRTVIAAALATAASFGALTITPIVAARELGMALGVGVVIALLVSLVAQRWLLGETGVVDEQPPIEAGRLYLPTRPARASLRTRVAAGVTACLIATAGWASLPSLALAADFQALASNLPAFDNARHIESVMGSSGEIAIALTGKDTVTKESLDWMNRAQDVVIAAHGDEMRPVISPPSLFEFLGRAPTADQLESALRLLPKYLATSVMRSDQSMSILSFGVKLDDAERLQSLRDDVIRILPPAPPGIEVEITGLPMVAVSGYEALSANRYLGAALGILVAGLVLLLTLRRRTDALLAVAAATLTTGFVLLGMRLGGIGLNPLTAAIGSLAAAVACEFTVVLAEAVRRRDVGIQRAVLLAAAASATGYGVLGLSNLTIIREFGLLLAITVGFAAAAAHFVVWLAAVGDGHTPIAETGEVITPKQRVGANR